MIPRFLFALCLAALATLPAAGQGRDRRGGVPGQFDFYVLALTWSPAFCQAEGARRVSDQCGLKAQDAFVVHGLWPQYDRGFPTECGFGRNPTRSDMDKAMQVFPDEGLARYEWRKHGTCAGGSPADYFEEVTVARGKVTIPEEFTRPVRAFSTTPLEVERAFVAANRGLRSDMMSVQCNRNVLREVRICFTRDLRSFVTCPEVNRSGCRARDITVPVGR
ncbi:MAG TPA: ribonuclease T2 [Beijerinckiaceae bacterium]|nr:ribonuclease T2 [Beijerinckiaceae bacterium]